MLIFVDPGEEGWGTLFAMVIGGAGIAGLVVYAILRTALKTKIRIPVGIETVLIIGVLYFGYKKSGICEFHLPHNFHCFVIIVYGVDNASKPETPLYSNKVKFKVPLPGIVLTLGVLNDNYSDPAISGQNTWRNS